ncbi:hypothetical protein Tco_0997362, partial [Tanacetum coccineum]
KLYDGNVVQNTYTIEIPDSEETLLLAKESRSKMILKQQDPMVIEKKVNTKPIDYNFVNSTNPSPSCTPSKVEVPKELPKVSLVNTSLKKLKYHLADSDKVVKERTTTTAITEGTWGFEHTRACFRYEIIPFVKALKEMFNTFDQDLLNELTEVQTVFLQMEQAVKQHRLESKTFELTRNLIRKFFKRDNSVSHQSAPNFDQYFELNELKAQSQEKDTVIKMLKERIKLLSGNVNVDKVKMDMDEIETLNIELEHKVSKLVAENEHLKQTYKQLYDSIKPAPLKNDLRKLKGKALVNDAVTKDTSDPEMIKMDMEPITPKLLNKRTARSAYIKHTQEEVAVLRDLVKHIKANYPPDPKLESAFRYTKLIQELLTNISRTCPSINTVGEKSMAVTTKNKDKRVRSTEPITSSGNTNIKPYLSSNLVSNKPVLSSAGVRPSTSASGSQPSGNTKKDKSLRPPCSNLKNKVEAHPRKVKYSLNNKYCVVELKGTASVQLSKPNTNSDLICAKCNGCMLSANHDLCVISR